MVSDKEPITPRIVNLVRERLSLSVTDMCYLLGIPLARWSTWMQTVNQHTAIHDPTVCMVVRYLAKYPEECPLRPPVGPEEVYAAITGLPGMSEMTKPELAILLGRESSTGYRWTRSPDRQLARRIPPALQRLNQLFLDKIGRIMAEGDSEKALQLVAEWKNLARIEGRTRGVTDIFETRKWPKEDKMIKGRGSRHGKMKRV